MIYVVATFTILPGTLEPFVELAYPTMEATRRELGCILYDLHASVTDPERVVFIEQWQSRDAFEAHIKTAHLAAFRAARKPYVVSAKVEVIHPDHVETL